MIKIIEIFILFIILSLLKYVSTENKLIFAFEITRHGVRSPSSGVKNEKDLFEENWTSNGELSDVGKRQLYLLGNGVRKRYMETYNLLSKNYNPQEIYIQSTDYNRTIESIYSFIQGLYPNGTGKTINEKIVNNADITFPPNINEKYKKEFENILKKDFFKEKNYALPFNMDTLPVHILNSIDDQFQIFESNVCPKLKQQYEKIHKNETITIFSKKLKNNTKDLFIEIEKNYTNNKNIKNNNFLDDYWTLYRYEDNLFCNNRDERNFSNFKEKYKDFNINLNQLIKDARQFLREDYFLSSKQTYKAVFSSSSILFDLVNWMEKAIKMSSNSTNSSYTKYVIYSANDLSIEALERFMNLYFYAKLEYIDFAERRSFELYHDNKKNTYQVKYLKGINVTKYNNTFKFFKEKIQDKAWSPSKLKEFCFQKDKDKYDINIAGATIMVILSVIDGVLIVLFILFCAKKR